MAKLISVVLPSYNEEKSIRLIYDELLKYADAPYIYEFIFINDGSTDQTWREIKALVKQDKRVKGICFSRNFGHNAALQAGLESAKGDAVIMLDADLQQPPKLIPQLLRKWEEGFEVVNTVRLSNADESLMKRLTGRYFYKLLNSISDLKLYDGEADFRLLSRRALDAINAMPETPKFYRGLVNWIGYEVVRIDYHAGTRLYGSSSYSFKKMIELARLGLTSFSMKPLKFIIAFGVTISSLSAVMLCVMILLKLWLSPLTFSDTSILVMFLIFVAGLLSTFQGIIAVYLVDIFNAAKGRPGFIVQERAGSDR